MTAQTDRDDKPLASARADCGWGHVLFGRTFPSHRALLDGLLEERPGERDIAYHITEPHVLVALAPQDLFLDPSNTYRLDLRQSTPPRARGISVRPACAKDQAAINRIYAQRRMVELRDGYLDDLDDDGEVAVLVAVSPADDTVIGVVMGIDHVAVFDDPLGGSSLWSLAVDPDAAAPGVGRALVSALAELYRSRGRAFMDLSVMHDNEEAVRLYEDLGFERIDLYCVKKKNSINEALFIAPQPGGGELNIYAEIIVTEARRRGIRVDIVDAQSGLFELAHGGRTIACRESLSDLTSAVALSRCDDKGLTARLLRKAGLRTPEQVAAGDAETNAAFLERHGAIVVKPVSGEQGQGVHVDLRSAAEVEEAVADARRFSNTILLERCHHGIELRIIVIDGEVVAAAERQPATVIGDGNSTLRELIEKQSRRRAAATGGESVIPLDAETTRCVANAEYSLDDILPAAKALAVRRTANLHTGGTLRDITAELPSVLADAAVRAARALHIPVVGLDVLVDLDAPADYVIIEANERPGLANHEPQPTTQRFIDLLFPETRSLRDA
ncbi:MAG: N-acetylglutaminylglutamine synthetase [Gammaproteobacteria bacterium]